MIKDFFKEKNAQSCHNSKGEKIKIILLKKLNCLLFTILHPFGTRESIRRKVDCGGQIVLWYWQHATNFARATVFIVYMSATRMLVWVRGRAEQKRSLTFYID